MGLHIHTGEPANPGQLRFHTGSLCYKDGGGVSEKQFHAYQVRRMWGVSWRAKWFLGLFAFSETLFIREQTRDHE